MSDLKVIYNSLLASGVTQAPRWGGESEQSRWQPTVNFRIHQAGPTNTTGVTTDDTPRTNECTPEASLILTINRPLALWTIRDRMPRTTAWATILFHHERGVLNRVTPANAYGFHVGIWWQNDQQLVAFRQPVTEIATTGHLVDSDLTHDSAWETARWELLPPPTVEYFQIPRGRILWDTVHRSGIVYHGNSTSEAVFKELARLYGLPRWEARLDEHYLTGEALEEFYRLE